MLKISPSRRGGRLIEDSVGSEAKIPPDRKFIKDTETDFFLARPFSIILKVVTDKLVLCPTQPFLKPF